MRSKVLPRLIRFEMERRGAWSCDPSGGGGGGRRRMRGRPGETFFFFLFWTTRKAKTKKKMGGWRRHDRTGGIHEGAILLPLCYGIYIYMMRAMKMDPLPLRTYILLLPSRVTRRIVHLLKSWWYYKGWGLEGLRVFFFPGHDRYVHDLFFLLPLVPSYCFFLLTTSSLIILWKRLR